MGLGFLVQADIPTCGVMHRYVGQKRLFSDIYSAIHDYVSDPLMTRMIRASSQDNTLAVELHPCAEPVEFLWSPSGVLQASAKTSTVGPGYHAFLIDILRHLESTIKLKWNWHETESDETDFAITGDYPALQKEMATLWHSLAKILLEQKSDDTNTIMVNMPLGFPTPQINAFAVTPLGPITKQCCQSIQSGDQEALTKACLQYFVWWNQEPDAAYWRNTGMMLLWCNVSWHAPNTEESQDMYRLALDCMYRARELNPKMELPSAELDELESLLNTPPGEQSTPPPSGIGYRRSIMLWNLTGGWSLKLPGYFYQTEEDDGSELVFDFDNRTIRFSSFTVAGQSDASPSPQDMLQSQESARTNGEEIVNLDNGHVQGWASIAPKTENGVAFWMLQGQTACENSLGIMTICYVDPADKAWAIETFESITHQ